MNGLGIKVLQQYVYVPQRYETLSPPRPSGSILLPQGSYRLAIIALPDHFDHKHKFSRLSPINWVLIFEGWRRKFKHSVSRGKKISTISEEGGRKFQHWGWEAKILSILIFSFHQNST